MDNKGSGQLTPVVELMKKAWGIYRERMWTLIAVGLSGALLPVLAFVPFLGLGYVISGSMPGSRPIVMVVASLLGLVGAVWLGNWGISAFLTAVVDQQCDIKQSFVKAKPKAMGHAWLGALTALIVAGGYLLLLVPGIIFSVWFFFAPFILIEEDMRGMDALLKSKAYVRGQCFPVVVRLAAMWALTILVTCIPFVGQLLALFLIPLSFIYSFLVYQDLKAQKDKMTFQSSKKEKISLLAASAFGFVLPVALIFAFMGSMVFMPFSMLKAKVTGQFPLPAEIHQGMMSSGIAVAPRLPSSNMNVDEDISLLEDKTQDWTKRSQAAFRLGTSKSKRAIAPLIKALENDGQWMVRQNAIKSLGRLNARRAVPGLIHALESDKNVFVRSSAARILGELGDKKALEPLKKALNDQGVVSTFRDGKNEKVKEVAMAAQKALKKLHVRKEAPSEPAPKTARAASGVKHEKKKGVQSGMERAAGLSGREAKKYREIIEACTKALRIQPKDSLTYHNRAVAHFRLGDYQQAINDFNKAISYDPKDATAYFNRAIAYGITGNHQRAIEDGLKAIELNPGDPDAYINLGIDCLSIGRLDDAVQDFTKAISLNARDASVYYARGVAYYKLGSRDKAISDFKNAAKKGSKKAQVYLSAQAAKTQS